MNFSKVNCFKGAFDCNFTFYQDKGADAFRRLKGASNLEDFHRVDIVIEAIVESEDVKKKLFAHLDKIVKGSAILASNTSSISITRLASITCRSSQVLISLLDT